MVPNRAKHRTYTYLWIRRAHLVGKRAFSWQSTRQTPNKKIFYCYKKIIVMLMIIKRIIENHIQRNQKYFHQKWLHSFYVRASSKFVSTSNVLRMFRIWSSKVCLGYVNNAQIISIYLLWLQCSSYQFTFTKILIYIWIFSFN